MKTTNNRPEDKLKGYVVIFVISILLLFVIIKLNKYLANKEKSQKPNTEIVIEEK